MRELPGIIIYRRLDGSNGWVERGDCRGWPTTQLSFHLLVVQPDGSERLEPYRQDTLSAHRGAVEPSLYRTPDGAWVRRAEFHEDPRPAKQAPLHWEVDEPAAHAWLAENRYEIPKAITKRRRQPGGAGAKCLKIYMDHITTGRTPPTASAIAMEVGCDRGTASRAIQPYEELRKARAKLR